jgi:hypothetical protein
MNARPPQFGQRTRSDAQDPFDDRWRMKAGDQVFGPYTGHQMCQFKTEGRLAAHSLVAREGGSTLEQQWHSVASDTVLGTLFRPSASASAVFGQKHEQGGSKFVLVIELKGGHNHELEAAIAALGRAYRVSPNLWLVSGSHTVGGLRNHLSQYLGPMDTMLVVDATQGRTGGFNMGPEADAHIRRVWREGL